jgi:hypothetical protein
MQDGTPGKKCDGLKACDGVDASKVSCGSCNGSNACYKAAGPIGESSCNGIVACFNVTGPIGEPSCNGLGACAGQSSELNSYIRQSNSQI